MRPKDYWRVLASLIPVVSLLIACTSQSGGAATPVDDTLYRPLQRPGWAVSSPVEQGLEARRVADLYRDGAELENLYGLVIVKNGYLVAEGYFNGRSVDSRWPRASVAKSYTSALAGIALAEGYLTGVDQRMIDFFPEFAGEYEDPRKGDITIRDMLKMRSGYPWEERTPPYLDRILSSNDWLPFLVEFPLTSDPGTEFGYSNLNAHLLGIIVARASGSGLMSFGQAHLFQPLGVRIGSWPYDAQGYTYGSGDISFSIRDMAKFGLLYLNDGLYEGQQLIPAQWVSESLQSYSTGIYGDRLGRYFRDIGYGYMWWSARAGKHDFNFAWGHGGNLIVLVHDLDMVVVATADPLLGVFGEASWKKERAVIDLVGKFISSLPSGAGSTGGATTQPSVQISASVDERISLIENGLVPVDSSGQPQWGETSTLAARMDYYQAPGVSVALIDDYALDWAKGYGVRVTGADDPVTADTLFHAGSVAKSLSAAATLTLVEQGVLNLDDDVNDRLVSWSVPENEHTKDAKVTLRRLLSHSAGLEDGLTDRGADEPMPAYVTFGDDVPTATLKQLLEGMPEDDIEPTRVVRVPGSSYHYANADYAILELLLQDRLGASFVDLVQSAVLDPLDMAHSSYRQPLPEALRTLSASEHTLDGKPMPGGRANFPFRAAGSLWTTPSDLAGFMIDLMQAYNGESGHLLSPDMAREMMSPQIEILDDRLGDAYGLGVELLGTGEGPAVWHSGGTWGSCSLMWFYPQIGEGAVVMTNSAGSSLLRLEILLSIASAYGWPMD